MDELVYKWPYDDIKDRAEKTRAVANTHKLTWENADWTVAQMDADIASLVALETAAAVLDSNLAAARGTLNATKDALHARTVADLGPARNHFAADPGKVARFDKLAAGGGGLDVVQKEGSLLIIAWEAADPLWAPRADHTLQSLKDLYNASLTQEMDEETADSNASARHKDLIVLANKLYDKSVLWYSTATDLFAASTAFGADIRAQIPTTKGGSSDLLHFAFNLSNPLGGPLATWLVVPALADVEVIFLREGATELTQPYGTPTPGTTVSFNWTGVTLVGPLDALELRDVLGSPLARGKFNGELPPP